MNANEFWNLVDRCLEREHMTITELAERIQKSRNTLFSQRKNGYMPKANQVKRMEQVLNCKLISSGPDDDSDAMFLEYLPYLKAAQEWQIQAVRQILRMPEKSLHS